MVSHMCMFDDMLKYMKGTHYGQTGKVIEVKQQPPIPGERPYERFSIYSDQYEILFSFQVCEDTLLLDIAVVAEGFQRMGMLTGLMQVIKPYMTGAGVHKFGVAGVISISMSNWCYKYGMRRTDGAERWGCVPKTPVDYIIDWSDKCA